MTWPLVYIVVISVCLLDAAFLWVAHLHVAQVHSRETAFRPRDDQSDHFPNHSHDGAMQHD